MNISAIIDAVRSLTDRLTSVLQGEPVLVIGNGAAVVIYRVATAFGAIPDQSFESALAMSAAANVTINAVLATIRQYVSPAN
jgi:hypothetical protein